MCCPAKPLPRHTKGEYLRLICKASLRRGGIEKALDPLKDKDFVALVLRLARDLGRRAKPLAQKELKKILAKLNKDWRNLPAAERDKALADIALIITEFSKTLSPATVAAMGLHTERMIKKTRRNLKRKYRGSNTLLPLINVSFTQADQKLVDAVSDIGVFVGNRLNSQADRLTEQLKRKIKEGVKLGLRSDEIAKDLKALVSDLGIEQDLGYWTVVANNALNTARQYGLMSGFARAGIEKYEWSSVMDERTTPICRYLDGKIFNVSDGLRAFDRIKDLKDQDPRAVATVLPFVRERVNSAGILEYRVAGRRSSLVVSVIEDARGKKDVRGVFEDGMDIEALVSNGLLLPPIHHLCRSTVLPVLRVV